MWHNLAFVAESQRLDLGQLQAFALANQEKYGILPGTAGPEVSSWHVEDLINDFRTAPRCSSCAGPVNKNELRCEQCTKDLASQCPSIAPGLDNCREPLLATCIGCGCDDLHACWDEAAGHACSWLVVDYTVGRGVCSCCPADVKRWNAGDRTVAVPVEHLAADPKGDGGALPADALARPPFGARTNAAVLPLRVWKFDDCDFVAAATLDEAHAWYDKEFGPPLGSDRRAVEEYALATPMRRDDRAHCDKTTFGEQIACMAADGQTFPAIIAMDAHYL